MVAKPQARGLKKMPKGPEGCFSNFKAPAHQRGTVESFSSEYVNQLSLNSSVIPVLVTECPHTHSFNKVEVPATGLD